MIRQLWLTSIGKYQAANIGYISGSDNAVVRTDEGMVESNCVIVRCPEAGTFLRQRQMPTAMNQKSEPITAMRFGIARI
jgi:hypothetical protein